jgi:hypothetical protein
MRTLLALALALGLASPVLGAGDDVTLPAPVVETKSATGWKVSRLGASRKDQLGARVTVTGRAAGAWVEGTDTHLTVGTAATRVEGYAVEVGGVSSMCAFTFAELITSTPSGYAFDLKSLLTTCLGGT